MSRQGPRCVHCAQYHGEDARVCPWTGKALPYGEAGPVRAAPPLPKSEPGDETRALLGQTLGGKYYVKSILGRGGMGTVYEGVNQTMGRAVALKVLHPKQLKKQESVKRFYQEARAAGGIGHPNICEVYDIGTLDNGCPYLVMERLVGETLSARMKGGVLPIPDAIDIMVQVLSGLVAAHEQGIIHRDLKPDNIFLSQRVGCPPVAKVLDFGVSKVVSTAPDEPRDEDLDLTRTGMVMGTPYYMSPEQASGARDLDGRVDLYACGVILYETLCGRRPFTAPNYHVLLWNILKTDPSPAHELRPDLPPALEAVIGRAMARDRDDRYSSAAEFIAALSHVRANLANYAAASRPATRKSVPPESAASRSAPPPPPPPPPAPVAESGERLANRPAEVKAKKRVPSSGKQGFDDIATEVSGLMDFSGSDEGEASTALMRDDEVAALVKSSSDSKAPQPFDPNKTEVMRGGPVAPRVADPYSDETLKMDRPAVPPNRKGPKSAK